MDYGESRPLTRKAMAYDIINLLEESQDLEQETTTQVIKVIKKYLKDDERQQKST